MDPLRPFANLVRSLSRARGGASSRAAGTGQARTGAAEQGATPEGTRPLDDLSAKLRARLQDVASDDPVRVRETFVAVVLAAELGEELPHDQSFAEIVRQVADRIGAHPQLNSRLQTLLSSLIGK